ncbi:hypothetical protein DV736_g846, partial [Chaetothyriales sp. CBS 134916]
MDGLLIDSEDAYTTVTNTILHEHGRPSLPWSIKAQLQGRPGPAASKIFRAWAQLPISEDTFQARQRELQAIEFAKVQPLPGVETLLQRLAHAHTALPNSAGTSPASGGRKVRLALATSSHARNFDIKTLHLQDLFSTFPAPLRVLGDDERIPRDRGKPLPDIYLLALRCVNEQIRAEGNGESEVTPEECLVFEDSVPGVEAGRRAGMRVVWVPHPGLLDVYRGREEDVLAGLTGEHKESDLDLDHSDGPASATAHSTGHNHNQPLPGSPGTVGQLCDGYAEMLSSLEDFDYLKYGISFDDVRYTSESGQHAVDGTTDRELEEMAALADGKVHAKEEEGCLDLDPVNISAHRLQTSSGPCDS